MHTMPKISWISGTTEKDFCFAFNWKSFQGACIRGNVYKSSDLGLVTRSWPHHPFIHVQHLITYLQLVRMSALIALALSDLTLNMIILTSAPSVGFENILLNTEESNAYVSQSSAAMANINSITLHPPTPSPNTSSFGKSCNSCLHYGNWPKDSFNNVFVPFSGCILFYYICCTSETLILISWPCLLQSYCTWFYPYFSYAYQSHCQWLNYDHYRHHFYYSIIYFKCLSYA